MSSQRGYSCINASDSTDRCNTFHADFRQAVLCDLKHDLSRLPAMQTKRRIFQAEQTKYGLHVRNEADGGPDHNADRWWDYLESLGADLMQQVQSPIREARRLRAAIALVEEDLRRRPPLAPMVTGTVPAVKPVAKRQRRKAA